MPDLGDAVLTDVNDLITADVDAAVAAATGLRLMGWAARESAAVPAIASFQIVNGATGAAGTTLVPVALPASGGDGDWYGPQGLDAAGGISIDFDAGRFDIALYHQTINPGG